MRIEFAAGVKRDRSLPANNLIAARHCDRSAISCVLTPLPVDRRKAIIGGDSYCHKRIFQDQHFLRSHLFNFLRICLVKCICKALFTGSPHAIRGWVSHKMHHQWINFMLGGTTNIEIPYIHQNMLI